MRGLRLLIQLLQQTCGQRGPAGLVAGSQTLAGFSVEILVKQNQVLPVRVILKSFVVAMAGATTIPVTQE